MESVAARALGIVAEVVVDDDSWCRLKCFVHSMLARTWELSSIWKQMKYSHKRKTLNIKNLSCDSKVQTEIFGANWFNGRSGEFFPTRIFGSLGFELKVDATKRSPFVVFLNHLWVMLDCGFFPWLRSLFCRKTIGIFIRSFQEIMKCPLFRSAFNQIHRPLGNIAFELKRAHDRFPSLGRPLNGNNAVATDTMIRRNKNVNKRDDAHLSTCGNGCDSLRSFDRGKSDRSLAL